MNAFPEYQKTEYELELFNCKGEQHDVLLQKHFEEIVIRFDIIVLIKGPPHPVFLALH